MSYYNDPINIINTSQSIGVGSGGSFTVDGGASIGKTLYVGKDLHVSGTTSSFADNLLVVNSNPTHTVDTGILFKRYSNDVSNNNNYSSIVYSEEQDRFILGYLQDDPGHSTSNISSLIGLQTSEITSTNILTTNISTSKLYVNGNEITGSGGSNWGKIGNDLLYTSGSVSIGSLRTDNISTGTVLASTQISSANIYALNVSAGTVLASTQISSANISALNVSTGTVLASTQISSANISALNVSAGTVLASTYTGANMQLSGTASIGTLTATTITGSNIAVSTISTGRLYSTGDILLAGGGSGQELSLDVGIGTSEATSFVIKTNNTARIVIYRNSGRIGLNGIPAALAQNTAGTVTFSPGVTLNGLVAFTSNLLFTGGSTLNIGSFTNSRVNIVTNDTIRMTVNTSGNVGIGTTSPNSRLDVTGAISNRGFSSQGNLVLQTADFTQTGYVDFNCITTGNVNRRLGYIGFGDALEGRGLAIYTDAGMYMNFHTNGVERIRIASSGNVGIGTISPTYQLQLSIDSAGKPNGGSWANSSDERLKENIELADLDICWDIVKNLPLKRYKWKDNSYTDEEIKDRNVIGWIAQDVVSVFPKAVQTISFKNVDGTVIDDCLSLNETMILRSLYGAVQKIMSELHDTKTELQTANEKITNLINFIQSKYPNEFEL